MLYIIDYLSCVSFHFELYYYMYWNDNNFVEHYIWKKWNDYGVFQNISSETLMKCTKVRSILVSYFLLMRLNINGYLHCNN